MQMRTCVMIEMKDVVANAFICDLEAGKTRRLFLFMVDEYAHAWVRKIKSTHDVDAEYLVTAEDQNSFCDKFSEYFAEDVCHGYRCIVLRDGVTAANLYDKFCARLSVGQSKLFRSVWQEINKKEDKGMHEVWQVLKKEAYTEESWPEFEQMYDFIKRICDEAGDVMVDDKCVPAMRKFYELWDNFSSETFRILQHLVNADKAGSESDVF